MGYVNRDMADYHYFAAYSFQMSTTRQAALPWGEEKIKVRSDPKFVIGEKAIYYGDSVRILRFKRFGKGFRYEVLRSYGSVDYAPERKLKKWHIR